MGIIYPWPLCHRLLYENPSIISSLILVNAKLLEKKILMTKQVGETWNLKQLKIHRLMERQSALVFNKQLLKLDNSYSQTKIVHINGRNHI